MRNSIATLVTVLTLAGLVRAQSVINAWPSKVSVPTLEIDSTASGLLATGTYKLDLEVIGGRIVGRLQQGKNIYEAIPFSAQGCDGVKAPTWSRRASVRRLSASDRKVEVKVAATNAKSCAITGVFTAEDPPIPNRPNPGLPEQFALAPLADLTIRAAKDDPDDPKKIRVEIFNDGPGKAAATAVKMFCTKNAKVMTGTAAVPALAAKTSVWVSVGAGFPINAADGVTARVDDPNKISETNETNNGYKFK
jgi:hypothetical protein